jgi:hypothetical protein
MATFRMIEYIHDGLMSRRTLRQTRGGLEVARIS